MKKIQNIFEDLTEEYKYLKDEDVVQFEIKVTFIHKDNSATIKKSKFTSKNFKGINIAKEQPIKQNLNVYINQ